MIDSYDAYTQAFEEAKSDGLMDSKELKHLCLLQKLGLIDDEAVKTVEKSIEESKLNYMNNI